MNVINLKSRKSDQKAQWLIELDRLLKEHFSIVHTDMGWSPTDVEREYASGMSPLEIVMRVGHQTDVIYTNQ